MPRRFPLLPGGLAGRLLRLTSFGLFDLLIETGNLLRELLGRRLCSGLGELLVTGGLLLSLLQGLAPRRQIGQPLGLLHRNAQALLQVGDALLLDLLHRIERGAGVARSIKLLSDANRLPLVSAVLGADQGGLPGEPLLIGLRQQVSDLRRELLERFGVPLRVKPISFLQGSPAQPVYGCLPPGGGVPRLSHSLVQLVEGVGRPQLLFVQCIEDLFALSALLAESVKPLGG